MLRVTRYHPLLVILHWGLAFLVIGSLAAGAIKLAHIPNSDPQKIEGLRVHMTAGMVILVLILLRLFVRNVTVHPPKATTSSAFLDLVAKVSHHALYVAMIAMPVMGLTLSYQAGLFGIVFGRHGTLPSDLWVYWSRWGHYIFSRILMFLIGLHICGALYHTLILRDGLLRRMWFGQRKKTEE